MSRNLSGLRWKGGISLETPQRKTTSGRIEGRISWVFSSCSMDPLEFEWDFQGPVLGTSGRSSLHASRDGPLGISLQSLPGPRSSSGVEAGTSGFLSRVDMDLGVPLGSPQLSQGLVSCEAMQVHCPLEPEKQFQASCRVDHRDCWHSLKAPQGCHICHRGLRRSSG